MATPILRRFRRQREMIALLASLLLATLPAAAADPVNINGDFEQMSSGWPEGWSRMTTAQPIRIDSGDGTSQAMRIGPVDGRARWVERRIEIDPAWSKLRLTARMKVEGLELGDAAWQNARILIRFDLTDGTQAYGPAPELSVDTDWTRKQVVIDVPDDATTLTLAPGIYGRGGTLWVDDLVLDVSEDGLFDAGAALVIAGEGLDAFDGGFDRVDSAGLPVGWQTAFAGGTITTEPHSTMDGKSGRFLRLSNEDASSAVFVQRRVAVPADAACIALKLRMRAPELAPGAAAWENARVQMAFVDADGERIGDWPPIPNLSEPTEQWQEMTLSLDVPAGAAYLNLQPILLHATGVADFDDIELRAVRAGQLPAGLQPRWGDEDRETLTAQRDLMVLNGLWRFAPAMGDSAAHPPEARESAWGWVHVPGSWKKASMPGVVTRGRGDGWDVFAAGDLGKAWYRRTVDIPADWADQAIVLQLDRVSTDATVYVNGERCGEVNWPRGEVRIDPMVQPGEPAVIDVLVVATTDAGMVDVFMGPNQVHQVEASLASAGLIGEVLLRTRPRESYLTDVFIKPSVSEQRIAIELELADVAVAGDARVVVRMLNEGGDIERRFETSTPVRRARHQSVEMSWPWENPRLWELGDPQLYTAVIEITGPAGLRDAVRQRFGFRETAVKGRDFILNGKSVRYRPINLPGEAWSGIGGSRPAMESLLRSYQRAGFNLVEQWPVDIDERGTYHFRELWCEVADELGIAMAASTVPIRRHLRPGDQHWDTPGVKERYEATMRAELKRYRNFASAVMWSTTPNAFGHSEDQNPRLIGRSREHPRWQREAFDQNWHERMTIGDEQVAMIKAADPTRPVMVHQGGPVGDVYALNNYLNWMPLQDRIEWLSDWARDGDMPYMAVEFGTPLHCSFMRGKEGGGWGRWHGASHSEALMTEYCAMYLGEQAYTLETDAYRRIVAAHYAPQRSEELGHPGMMYETYWGHSALDFAPANQAVREHVIRETWQHWRAMGVTGGMVPWADAHGFEYGPAADRLDEVPGNRLGARGMYLDRIKARWLDPYAEPAVGVLRGGEALLATNGPTLAFIAGKPERFTSQDHHFNGGGTVSKQVSVINDTRSPQAYEWHARIRMGERIIEQTRGSGTVGVSETRFDVLTFDLPNVDAKADGVIELTAQVGDAIHEDRFEFRVYPAVDLRPGQQFAVVESAGTSVTREMLASLGGHVVTIDASASEEGMRTDLPVFIGSGALDENPGLLRSWRGYVEAGNTLVVMAQHPEWYERYAGLRVNPQLLRRVFPVAGQHPITNGLDAVDLADWTGVSTLVEPYPDYLHADVKRGGYSKAPWHGWRWGGYGAVSSAAIEIPHRSGWTPLLRGGFDLAYSPLMELSFGSGRVLLCTLDLEDHYQDDPAAAEMAIRLMNYASESVDRSASGVKAVSLSGYWRDQLDSLGVKVAAMPKASTGLMIVDLADAGDRSTALAHLRDGGRVLVVGGRPGDSWLGVEIASPRPIDHAFTMPDWPETRGLSIADLRTRSEIEAPCFVERGTPDSGINRVEIGAEGLLARVSGPSGGVAVFTAIDPGRLDIEREPYLRYTRWRHTRTLSQLIANLGGVLDMDARLFEPEDAEAHTLSLAGEWQALFTGPLPPAVDYHANAHRDEGPSPKAFDALRQASRPVSEIPMSDWDTVRLPGDLDSFGSNWRNADGEAVFARRFNLPANWQGHDLVLSLGAIDDFDQTYVNGRLVGATGEETPSFYSHPRHYTIAAEVLKPGTNVIAVRMFDRFGGGGFAGEADEMMLRPARPDPPGFYHPDYRDDFAYGDDPYRYCRW